MDNFPDFNHDGQIDSRDYALWDEIADGSSEASSGGDSYDNSGCSTLMIILIVIAIIFIIL